MTSDATFASSPEIATPLESAGGGPSPVRAGSAILVLRNGLQQAVSSSKSKDELLQQVARSVEASRAVELLAYVGRDDDQSPPRPVGLLGTSGEIEDRLSRLLIECAARCCARQDVQILDVAPDTGLKLAAVPVCLRDCPSDVLLAVISDRTGAIDFSLAVLALAAMTVSVWHADRFFAQEGFEGRSAAALVELAAKVQAEADLRTACQTLVDQLQQHLGCLQVVVGSCRPGRKTCRVRAISGSSEIDARSERVRAIEAAMDEAIVRGALTVWPPPEDSDRHAMLAHRRLGTSTSSACVISSPIRDAAGEIHGAWIFLGNDEFAGQPQKLNFIRAAEQPVGSCLNALGRAERGRIHRVMAGAVALPRRWPGRIALAACVLVAGLLIVPLPHKVKCSCELEPVTRRFVAAPFDGTLERSFVEPGDLVTQDQLLARIDGREIRWELAGIAADLNRAAKQRDGHLAEHEFGAVQVSQYEVERLKLRKQLLEHRNTNLEIRSPMDGIVIVGDMKKAEGAPLATGQTLFEIAPLDRMIVEVGVPDEEISRVAPGLPVDLVLESFPGEHWSGELARIHPRSEVKEDEHVFIGEMELENPNQLLRPGMQGRARITSRRRPLGWILFHKPWEKFVFWMGW